MKNGCLLLLSVIILSFSSFSQANSTTGRYEKLMKSSARKRSAGIAFLTGGAVLAGGGILLVNDGVNRQDGYDPYSTGLSRGESEQVLGIILTGIGAGCMGGSIPFFVGAHRSAKKAMRLSMKTESSSLLYKTNFLRRSYPAFTLSIPLGR